MCFVASNLYIISQAAHWRTGIPDYSTRSRNSWARSSAWSPSVCIPRTGSTTAGPSPTTTLWQCHPPRAINTARPCSLVWRLEYTFTRLVYLLTNKGRGDKLKSACLSVYPSAGPISQMTVYLKGFRTLHNFRF